MSRRDYERTVALLTNGSAFDKERATRALGNLAYDAANQVAIAAAGAIPPLVALVTSGTASARCARARRWELGEGGRGGPGKARPRLYLVAGRPPQAEKASRKRRLEAPECVVCFERARAVALGRRTAEHANGADDQTAKQP